MSVDITKRRAADPDFHVGQVGRKTDISRRLRCIRAFILYMTCVHAQAQEAAPDIPPPRNPVQQTMMFSVQNPDYGLSPYTGMTRRHWLDAARYLLAGAFGHVRSIDDALVFPRQPGKSYPRDGVHTSAEKLEGLSRTLFIAAPLLREEPGLRINGLRLAEYYRHQLRRIIDRETGSYIEPRAPEGRRSKNLVELGGLALSLFVIPEILWEPLSKTERDALASLMLSHGEGPTSDSNWRFFNIFILSFLDSRGYQVDRKLLEEHLEKALAHYRGQGWYSDNPAFDYYSMWAFQLYGLLWSEYYGGKRYPAHARRLIDNFSALKHDYPYMFGRNGSMIMWGRSISYRFAAIAPLPLFGFVPDSDVNYGWMRRIASGVLLQFLRHPEFMKDGVPTLGFYGAFEPAVQSYSARASVYWAGKAFLGLLAPADNPFWTTRENEGAWERELTGGRAHNRFLPGPQLLITNYPETGIAEIRPWCDVKAGDPEKARSEDYNRLAYNSAFPWQADGTDGVVAMNYAVRIASDRWEPLRSFRFIRFEDDVYYRDAALESAPEIRFHLADIPLPNGVLRIDEYAGTVAGRLRLGHYALPRLDGAIKEESRTVDGHAARIISNGVYQLAMVSLAGLETPQTVHVEGLHPEAHESAVLNVSGGFAPASEKSGLYAVLMLWRKGDAKWADQELLPVTRIARPRQDGKIVIYFRDGSRKTVSFNRVTAGQP